MAERFIKLFSLKNDLYIETSPVVISAGALLRDNESGQALAQLKFKNISGKTIKGIKVEITPLDTVGRALGESVTYTYLDLALKDNVETGQKVPVYLPNPDTRSFNVHVTEVYFEGDTVQTIKSGEWKSLVSLKTLESELGYALAGQYRIEFKSPKFKYVPQNFSDIWLCSCGKIHHNDVDACCGIKLETQLAKLDKEALKKAFELRKLNAAYDEAVNLKYKANRQAAHSEYSRAAELYDSAIAAFERLGDFKDAIKLLEKCRQSRAEAAKRENERREKEEQRREEEKRRLEKEAAKRKTIAVIVIVFIAVVIIISVLLDTGILQRIRR